MADGGMNLRKWHFNLLEMLETINSNLQESDQRQVPAPSQLVGEDDTYRKTVIGTNVCTPSQEVLGVLWNSVLDVFTFEVDGLLSMPTPCQLVEYANSLPW